MKKEKYGRVIGFFIITVVFLCCVPFVSWAQENEESLHIPGIVEGSGKHFEINDSEYLNVSLDSSENIAIRIESAPEMVTIEIQPSENANSADVTLSGFTPSVTYHKYEDNYHNHMPFVTDENGVFSFTQDIRQGHLIFIQPRKSTKFINDTTGGDCASIGIWDLASKTCTLNQDINETIQIDSDNITLDGAGHRIDGNNRSGVGVYANHIKGIVVKNVYFTKFNRGIYFYYCENGKAIQNILESNSSGIEIDRSKKMIISKNIFKSNSYGIYHSFGDDNIFEGNDISNTSFVGINIESGKGNVLRDNVVKLGISNGIWIAGANHNVLSGNVIQGNKKGNLSINSIDMGTNNVDTSNIVEDKPVYYIKGANGQIYDGSLNAGSLYFINCENIKVQRIILPENGSRIVFWHTNNSSIERTTSVDNSSFITLDYSTFNTVSENTFKEIFLRYQSSNNRIFSNNLMDTYSPIYIYGSSGNIFNLDLPVGGNYWKKYYACRDVDNNGICDSSYYDPVSRITDRYPVAKNLDFDYDPVPAGNSSVLFLPGHQASRLYKKDPWGEMKLWEPENKNIDVEKLYLKPNGESVDSGIYTRDIIGEAYDIKNIYQGFSESMDKFVYDGEIKEWKPIPYDWRLSLEEIAEDGIKLEYGGHMDIINEIKRMAETSKTGKVTLIGHSNGGLLAKVLIEYLENSGNKNLIDKLIMVGTPQLGTPKAMVALLHGDEANLLHSLVLDKETGRGFAENMVSAYNLLPSKKYFSTVQSPVVEFDEDVKEIYDFRSLYGNSIGDWEEFKSFLLGDDGTRTEPEASDLDAPNVLRETLLVRSDTTHDELDSWQAPEGVEVVQIAGWGLDTIRGIEYDDCDILFCPDKLSNLDRSLLFTADGDETVVVPSAVEMGGNAERYYLNIKEYNKELIFGSRINRNHASILEIEPLQDFIKNIIKGDKTLTDYISLEKPEVKDADMRLRFRLHSPVMLDLYDEGGNHTGFIKNNDSDLQLYEEQISNSYYAEFGETKYAGAGDLPVDIILTGEDLGTFTFEIDQVAGESVTRNTTFANIPVMKDMQARLFISETVSEMKIDVDADGQTDAIFSPGEEIKKADLLEIFEKIINSLSIDRAVKNRLINKIDNAQKQMEKENLVSANAMLESVKQQIRVLSREETPQKFRISEEEAEKLIRIIEQIQAME